jgi:C-methyltransferase
MHAGYSLRGPFLSHRARFTEGIADMDDLAELMKIAWSFVPFNVAEFAVKTRLFETIHAKPVTIDALANKHGWMHRPTRALVQILASIKLVEIKHELVYLTAMSQSLLPGLNEYLMRNVNLQDACGNLDALMQDATPAQFLRQLVAKSFGLSGTTDTDAILRFGMPMRAVSMQLFTELLDQFMLPKKASVLDIGGGLGALVQVLIARGHTGTIHLIDTPSVAETARKVLETRTPQVTLEGCNWNDWSPKRKYKLVVLAHVLHEEKFEKAHKLFSKAVRAVAKGGALIVVGFMGEEGEEKLLADIFRLNMLLEMDSDLPTREWLDERAQEFNLAPELFIKLSGGRRAWIARKR